ncbi:MAG: TetR family transcriptional regulator [Gemmatimonadetes bacterium]|nr:TetR family transcriptional regulator [Gemmatimonadota bacterium]
MRAVVVEKTGWPEVLAYRQTDTRQTDTREPGPGEVRVRVVGVNFIDVYHRTGLYPLPLFVSSVLQFRSVSPRHGLHFHVNMTDMKGKPATRSYRMRARADAATQTARDILGAASALWREKALDELTLQEIAERAGVSVQTVIRRFGSKEGVIEACIVEADAAGIEAERDAAPIGNIERVVKVLFGHYERDGDAVLRTLAQEDKLAAAKAIVTRGRQAHRLWCARVFAPYLPSRDADGYSDRLDAFVAATDIYLWKLLRRDLGRSPEQAQRVIGILLSGLVSSSQF